MKRDKALAERSLDFVNADGLFDAPRITFEDARRDYGEIRLVTIGILEGRMIVVCWTPRGDDRHVFSMRKAMTGGGEQRKYASLLR